MCVWGGRGFKSWNREGKGRIKLCKRDLQLLDTFWKQLAAVSGGKRQAMETVLAKLSGTCITAITLERHRCNANLQGWHKSDGADAVTERLASALRFQGPLKGGLELGFGYLQCTRL